ncbi:MAG: hypothetical protein HY000_26540 [Planctomycetes bacterium]|nr:hypothetical protein [Planctomycetota bacterium]
MATAPEGEDLLRAIPLVKPTTVEQCEQMTAGTFTRFDITNLAQKLVEFWNERPPYWVPHGDRCCNWKARLKTLCSRPAPTPIRFSALTLTLECLPTRKVATRSQECITVIRTGQYLFHAEKRLFMGFHLEEDSGGKVQRL